MAGATIVRSSVTHGAFFAGMRIEAGDREPWSRNAEAVSQVASYDAPSVDDQIGRSAVASTCFSGRWMVTGTTASSGDHSIMTGWTRTRSAPRRAR